jgi:predicted acylesterase/phospholipase RssA
MRDLNITHLVISGGGMRGAVYIGALRYLYLENLHKNITHISGTSIGAFIGLAIAFKLDIEDIEDIVKTAINDTKLCNIPYKNCIKIITECGLTNIDLLTNHMKNKIKTKYKNLDEKITFLYLAKRFGVNYYISTTNIYTCKNKMFCLEDTPNVCVFKACAASMSIPLLFKPTKIGGDYYYDGGLTNNLPINIFKDVPYDNILGLLIHKDYKKICDDSIVPKPKISILYLLKQLINIYEDKRVKIVIEDHIDDDNIDYYYIPDNYPDIKLMNFEFKNKGIIMTLTDEVINNFIYSGFESMSKYIEKRRNKLIIDTNKLMEANNNN